MSDQQHLHSVDRSVGELDDIGSVPLQGKAPFFEARPLDHLLDHPVDLVRFRDQEGQHRASFERKIPERAGLEHRQITLDHRHRPTQLVRGDVQEIRLCPLKGRDLGTQGHTVETRRDAGRVLAKTAELVVTEHGAQATGDDHHRAGTLAQVEWDDQRRTGAPRGAAVRMGIGPQQARASAQSCGVGRADPARGEDGTVCIDHVCGLASDQALSP